MIDAEKIIRALKVFDGQTILYDSLNGEKVTFRDIIDFIEKQSEAISKRDELIMLQRENIDTTHVNNMKLREEIERLMERLDYFQKSSDYHEGNQKELEIKNAELQKQVDELKEQLNYEKNYEKGVMIMKNVNELMNEIKEQCGDCEAWSGTDCTRNPYTQGCLKDENQVIECHCMLKGCDAVKQAVKDTAKEIIDDLNSIKPTVRENYGVSELVGVDMAINRVKDLLKRKGVEV